MSNQDFRNADEKAEAEADRAIDERVTGANAGPVDDQEAQAAAEGLKVTEGESKAYTESIERGAKQKGEGAPEV